MCLQVSSEWIEGFFFSKIEGRNVKFFMRAINQLCSSTNVTGHSKVVLLNECLSNIFCILIRVVCSMYSNVFCFSFTLS